MSDPTVIVKATASKYGFMALEGGMMRAARESMEAIILVDFAVLVEDDATTPMT
jgi:hypothetical protein